MGRTKKKFCQYKADKLPLSKRKTVSGRVRLFMWSLVQKVQQDHDRMICRVDIDRESIFVRSKVAILTGPVVGYTTIRASRNYWFLLKFFEEDLFGDVEVEELPYSITHFLNLFRHNPFSNRYLIARHYGVLPTRLRIQLISNLISYPSSMDARVRLSFYSVIDDVTVDAKWENNLKSSDSVLLEQFNLESSFYLTTFPPLRTFFLLKFFRNLSQHIGCRKRTMFALNEMFDQWTHEKKEALLSTCSDQAEKPNLTQTRLVRILLDRFPHVLTDVLNALHDEGLLKYMCINPLDQWVPSSNEVSI